MDLALQEAWKNQLLTFPNPAVGALLLDQNDKIIALESHVKAGGAHAEVLALQKGYAVLSGDDTILKLTRSEEIHAFLEEYHGGLFQDCTLYTTLEPCNSYGKTPPCSQLIISLAIRTVVIGMADESNTGGSTYLQAARVDVHNHVLLEESRNVLLPFLLAQKGKLVVFKWAQHLNGVIDGGLVSDEASRTHMHHLRALCDTLVVGGNTVRKDRPTLDARLVEGKSPNVFILSNSTTFDQTIPLFQVPDREVTVGSLEKLSSLEGFILIEGGETLLTAVKTLVDLFIVYETPHIKMGKTLQGESFGKRLFSQKLDNDTLHFIQRITYE